MKKILTMAAMALLMTACSNDIDEPQAQQQPANTDGMITITAKLAPKSDAGTRAVTPGTDSQSKDIIKVTWAENEHLAILYEVSGEKKVADATITAVDATTGAATMTFAVDGSTADDTPCTIVYPLAAAKDDKTGVKDAATLLATQMGTLNANLDVRVGAGTISTTTPSLAVTTQPVAQFAIHKFKIQDLSATDKTATEFKVSDASGNVITTVTPSSATGTLYIALPVLAGGTYWFNATIDNKPYINKATTSAATTAGTYYQSTVKMATLGNVIGENGKFYVNATSASSASTTARAMITYVGIATGEATYGFTHGLALAMSDANGGSTINWSTSTGSTVHTYTSNNINFTSESGLQYNNETHNSDTYPAFKAAMVNNGTAAPTSCSAWFLPTAYQWNQMINACKNVLGTNNNYTDLRDGFNGVGGNNLLQSDQYLSSTESSANSAWVYDFTSEAAGWHEGNKGSSRLVRSALAF